MTKIRLLLSNPTRLLRDVLYKAIWKQPDMEVAGEVSEVCSLLHATELIDPDCLVIGMEETGVPIIFCKDLLGKNTRTRILAVSETAGIAALCWWCQGEVRCHYMEASSENLLAALRSPLS